MAPMSVGETDGHTGNAAGEVVFGAVVHGAVVFDAVVFGAVVFGAGGVDLVVVAVLDGVVFRAVVFAGGVAGDFGVAVLVTVTTSVPTGGGVVRAGADGSPASGSDRTAELDALETDGTEPVTAEPAWVVEHDASTAASARMTTAALRLVLPMDVRYVRDIGQTC